MEKSAPLVFFSLLALLSIPFEDHPSLARPLLVNLIFALDKYSSVNMDVSRESLPSTFIGFHSVLITFMYQKPYNLESLARIALNKVWRTIPKPLFDNSPLGFLYFLLGNLSWIFGNSYAFLSADFLTEPSEEYVKSLVSVRLRCAFAQGFSSLRLFGNSSMRSSKSARMNAKASCGH